MEGAGCGVVAMSVLPRDDPVEGAADKHVVSVDVPLGWLLLVASTSLLGALTTALALALGPGTLREGVTFTRLLIAQLGLVRALALIAVLKILVAVAVAEGGRAAGAWATQYGVPAWYPPLVRHGTYLVAGGAYAWFAMWNLWLLGGVL